MSSRECWQTEQELTDQQTKSESTKSTGTQDSGTHFCATTNNIVGNNSNAKTLIEYNIDATLDIKEEIVQDEEEHQWEKDNFRSERNQVEEKCIATEIFSNNSGARNLIEYNIDETLDIKEEIIQDEGDHQWVEHNFRSEINQIEKKCIATEVASNSNSGARTFIEYNIDETLDIKKEISQDKDGHQQGNLNLLSGTNQCDEKYITSEAYFDNNSGTKTLIEHDYDESLDSKEGIIQGGTVKKPRTPKKEKIQESKSDPKKKYNCKRCGRSYFLKSSFRRHKKFECGVMPQFRCEFCCKKFKIKSDVNKHILRVHQKTHSKASETRHNCDQCSRSYSAALGLYQHKRLEHATVISQFICDFCCFHTHRKNILSKHINSFHMPKVHLSVRKREHKCEKCGRSYTWKAHLNNHKKFECGVMPQFRCEFCSKRFKIKSDVNNHILRVHQKSETRHNCDQCTRSYSAALDLYQHKRLEHVTVRSQFICDFCCFHTHRKDILSKHINARHMPKVHLSIREREHKCEKCGRSYIRKTHYNRHKKFECDVIPQFSCEFCGKLFKRKACINRHILRMHQIKKEQSISNEA